MTRTQDLLADFYRNHGYLDFEIKNVQFDNPTTNTLVIRYYVYEGRQYKVGSIKLTGNKIFSADQISAGGMEYNHAYQQLKGTAGPERVRDGRGQHLTRPTA